MSEIAGLVLAELGAGREAVVGRVTRASGFSTLPVDQMVVVDSSGDQHGDLLGRPGSERIAPVARELLAAGARSAVATVTVEIDGADVEEVGLGCGGVAQVLLQRAGSVPTRLWELLSARQPAALVTDLERARGGGCAVVDRDGRIWGDREVLTEPVAQLAGRMLASGTSGVHTLEGAPEGGMLEVWVPEPRVVIVGAGELVAALRAQASLIDWQVRSTVDTAGLGDLLEWAGSAGALVVLSHDAQVDVPALAIGLARGTAYVGAMGSRSTQSRRLEALRGQGVSDVDLERIHRPIGLDLGGRRSPQVALAIVAEIMARHFGRDARPLRERSGPIH